MADLFETALAPGGNARNDPFRRRPGMRVLLVIDAPWLHAEAALGLCGPPANCHLGQLDRTSRCTCTLSFSVRRGRSLGNRRMPAGIAVTFKLRIGDRITSLIETAFSSNPVDAKSGNPIRFSNRAKWPRIVKAIWTRPAVWRRGSRKRSPTRRCVDEFGRSALCHGRI